MALIRWSAARDPFQEWFDEAFREVGVMSRALDRLARPSARLVRQGPVGYPPLNLYEDEDKYLCVLPAPGLDAEKVDVSLDNDSLIIQAERSPDAPENSTYVRIERPAGRFVRSVSLPRGVDVDAAEATYENGVLIITVPKTAEAKARKIRVRS